MKTKILRLLSLVALIAAMFGAPGSLVLAAGPVVSVSPASSTVAVDQTIVVQVNVADVTGLFGAEFHLTFDPAKVEVVDADAGTDGIQIGIGDFLAADFVAQNTGDNATGKIDFGLSQMAPHGPVSGSGTLATITLKGKAAGSSNLSFTGVLLADSGGGQIAATAQNGSITVEGEATVTPEPTAEPTETTTPAPTTAPTTVPSTCDFQGYHVVKAGETLYSIGRAYATKPTYIASCNGIVNASRIYVGTKLGIPVAPWSPVPAGPTAVKQFTPGDDPAPTPGCRYYHTVAYGDTLTAIAIRYGSSVWSIGSANSIVNLNLIYAGQVLCIP